MVGIAASADSSKISILGYGLSLDGDFQIAPHIKLSSSIPRVDSAPAAEACRSFTDYAAVVHGRELASFSIVVTDNGNVERLVRRAWNTLWLFHLLSVACRSPVLPLFAVCDGKQELYSSTSRMPLAVPISTGHTATLEQLCWARDHLDSFNGLVDDSTFSSAMRCFGNAHCLLDTDVKIMLLWAGIEGLLSVDAELSRRIALYSALLISGTPQEKMQYFEKVKTAYNIRSRVVHGSKANSEKITEGYQAASQILSDLLARCTEIGRVPTAAELDHLAVSGSFV